jgi:hypothetical protein
MKHLTAEQIAQVATPVPMSRADKIERWASLVERHSSGLQLYSNLERTTQSWRDNCLIHDTDCTAFALAVNDPVLREAGLVERTLGACQRFFELSLADLHEFSCDCGGHINNATMASSLRAMKDKVSRSGYSLTAAAKHLLGY